MPTTPTYPGVYIEEIPSGVRTITGVPTSITAFVGSARRGPVDEPRRITSWADFQRVYGGLWLPSTMSYAVYHYYQNGGSDAVIVRIHNGATAATLDLGNGVTLRASNPGSWGARLRSRVEYPDQDDDTTYNLIIRDVGTGDEERFLNVSTDESSPRGLARVLRQSSLVEPTGDLDALPEENEPNIPLDTDVGNTTLTDALRLCVDRRAMLLVDAPEGWGNLQTAVQGISTFPLSGDNAKNAAIYFPRIRMEDPEQGGLLEDFPAAGAVAGVIARTDGQRGVWKAPA